VFCRTACHVIPPTRNAYAERPDANIPSFVAFGVLTTGGPTELVKMTFGGVLVQGPRKATTTISVQSRSFGRHFCSF
jgi:hypothetical protein